LVASGLAAAETLRDEFNQQSYANNDGSRNWAGDWQEIGESNGPTSGQVRVVTDGSNSYVLRIQQTRGAERQANLSGATAATFNFSYRRSSLDDASVYVTVEVSGDGGGNWVELDRFSGPSDDSSYRSASYDITAYATANTRIRFNGSSGMDGNDRVYFDNVEMDYSQAAVPQLVAHYALEGNATDASGNGHNGSSQETVAYGRGKVCDGLVVDGSGYLLVPDHVDFDMADELTVMAWLRPDSLSVSGHDNLYSFLSKDTNYEFHLQSDGSILWWWGSGSLTTPAGLVQTGVWQHVAFVYSRSAGVMQVYVDGSLAASRSFSAGLPLNNDSFYIGTDKATGGGEMPSRRFYGAIDEVRVYSEALSATQISDLMTQADPCALPTPLAEWRFDECNYTAAGALATDTRGSHDAAAQGGVASEASGVVGRAAELDRSAESFTTGNDVPMQGDWTVSSWFRMPFAVSEGSRYHVLGAMAGGNDLLWLDNRNSFRWGGYANSNIVNGRFLFNTLSDGWHHLLLVGEGGTTSLYIDGNYRDQVALQARGNLHYIGTSYDDAGGNQGFRAPLDEFIVFDEVLDQTQIDTLYQLQSQGRNLDGSLRAEIFCGATIDHFELIHDGSALTCAAEAVTVRACTNVDCSSVYTDPVTITLSPSGWVGGDVQTLDDGSGIFQLRHTTPGSVTLAVTGNPAADQSQQCVNSGGNASCDLVFREAGFLFDVPDHRACTTEADITIAAVRADATAEHCIGDDSFANTSRQVNFWSDYQQPASGSQAVQVNGVAISGASPGTQVDLAFDGQAESRLNIRYDDAGRLNLSAYFAGSGDEAGLVMTGGDSFVVAPDRLRVVATSDGTAALDNATFTGTPHWPAGVDFYVEVAGVCSDGTVTANFEATTSLAAVVPFAPATGTLGALTGGPLTAVDYSSGVGQADDVSYSEVGTVTIGAEVFNYLGSSLAVTGSSDPVGRFTPHHFLTSLNTPQFATGCNVGSFTYLGQPFDYVTAPVITVTAQNLQNGDTQNYAGDWWKLSSGTLNGKSYSAATGSVDISQVPAGDPSVTELGAGMGLLTFSAGSGLKMDRGAPTAPYDADISLEINVIDGDGIAATSNPVRFGAATSGNGISFDNGKEMRWGRLTLNNAYGSELLALDMPLRAEYYAGTAFIPHSGDSCTSLPLAQLSLNNGSTTVAGNNSIAVGSGTTSASLSDPFVGGNANLRFTPPGDDGFVDVTADLSLLGWLRYDWDGEGTHDNNPLGRATFGLYEGRPSLIYLRETYR
jgi:MSHA biogenesis protein MshQ